jgi:hypothetical protein
MSNSSTEPQTSRYIPCTDPVALIGGWDEIPYSGLERYTILDSYFNQSDDVRGNFDLTIITFQDRIDEEGTITQLTDTDSQAPRFAPLRRLR